MIEIKSLTKVFPDAGKAEGVAALRDVNLSIQKGDIFGIIGMSGAGKSTLLRCLAMLETPTSGEIWLDGKNLATLTGEAKRAAHRDMGVMFQGYNLLMQRTVADNIAFPLKLAGGKSREEITQRVAELLFIVGLSDKAASYPAQLSGGQKQRVALARALATNPKVLLADEPTSALDSLTTKNVLALLREVNERLGITIIIITHEIAVVKSICNRVAVIDDSRFVEVGDTKQIFRSPQSDITRLLLGQEVKADG